MRTGRWIASGGAVLATLLAGVPAITATAATPVNLVADHGAESAAAGTGGVVPIPGWTRTTGTKSTAVKYGSPGFPSTSSPGPTVRENNFFAGGPNDPNFDHQVLSQSVPLPSSEFSNIDAGTETFHAQAFLG